MERTELKAGDECYYDPHSRWLEYGGGLKAVVVDAGEPFVPDSTNHVLVELHDQTGPVRSVVRLVDLRGPYEETLAGLAKAAEQ